MSSINTQLISQRIEQLGADPTGIKQSSRSDSKSEVGETVNTFSNALKNAVAETNDLNLKADQKISELIAGKNKDIHGTMIALEKADISFRLMMQIRNKVIDAYQEVMRMQV